MSLQLITFYLFATILVVAALRVVTARNPVHAALFLVLSFVTASGLWVLIQAEFLGVGLVLIYVGAVMVLFLFVVMMLNIDIETIRKGFWKSLPLAGVVAAIMVGELVLLLKQRGADVGAPNGVLVQASNSKALGKLLYTDYIYAFEVAGVLLLVAIIAAVALTLRHRKDQKYVDPGMQAKVKREDRVRLVQMAAEKPQAPAAEQPAAE
ncbi:MULTISPECIES: NADH-quinone oxidoreductase subunit J [Leeia]|uniref:NADH-quinone oxidoreductase subunit J n=1 Tax=Leeia aquatica TaxID=2725557 RepID=A0A847S9M9_9NEIS|nr:NADH-quinone oxidoreductase subunit J [Leeia aquatica]NLR74059.1 NADH-quinone oxidoreductase subunit J [Leeia aquatica]